ncbi:hypothetical protein GCM10010497_18630 [Streptomyces cinereoruber]|uniref:Uncharacterized protein n=1 Tax=Streptomyces cinereoruber TaxID=67260 RepID=A0AAV4KIV6_9ACTN|nr:hypothetical protein GCM10010497_18630 [Streptomyces cinereoruber]
MNGYWCGRASWPPTTAYAGAIPSGLAPITAPATAATNLRAHPRARPMENSEPSTPSSPGPPMCKDVSSARSPARVGINEPDGLRSPGQSDRTGVRDRPRHPGKRSVTGAPYRLSERCGWLDT